MNHYRAISAAIAAALCFAAVPETASAAGRANLGGLASGTTFDQFIVKYRDGTAERRDTAIIDSGLARASQAVVPRTSRTPLLVRHFRRMSLGADVIRVDRKLDRVDAETLMRQIAADPNVEYVEIDARMYPTVLPNDPRFSEQWHYFNTPAGVNLPNAWDKSTGSGVVVAVIDTGITPHSDLSANTVAGYDFITNTASSRDGNGRDGNPNDEGDWTSAVGECGAGSRVANSSWHGTHVAGTVAALTNNAVGVAGVAYGARVQPVRALGRCGGTLSDIADAIIWASGGAVSGVPANATPARIINMSLGAPGACSTTFQNAINSAIGRGTTVVAAAGNDNINVSGFQPGGCGNVIAVGATDSNGARASFSNYGTGVDIAAPGVGILSTLNNGAQTQGAETYVLYNGTSMASPHVAGVAALVQSRRAAAGLAAFTPAQLESHLKSTARAFPSTPSQPIGTGIVNADAAVTAAIPALPNLAFRPGLGGAWYNPNTSGQGFGIDIDSTANYVFGGWYTYAATGGAGGNGQLEQRWYTLQGNFVPGETSKQLPVYLNTGGKFDSPPTTQATAVGNATLSFQGCNAGRLDYQINVDGQNRNGTVPLTRLGIEPYCTSGAFPTLSLSQNGINPSLNGAWYDPNTSGQGFQFVFLPSNANTAFLFWYTYDINGLPSSGTSGQRWYTIQGSYTAGSNQVLNLPILQSTGGRFEVRPPNPTNAQVGTADLVFHSCTSASLTYRFNNGLTRTISLSKLLGGGASCAP
jgi:serine protease